MGRRVDGWMTGLVAATLMGCAGARTPQSAGHSKSVSSATAPEGPLTLEQLVISQTTAESLRSLFARGRIALERGDYVAAESDFALCVRAQPDGELSDECLYHGAIACDEQRKFESAMRQLLELAARFPNSPYVVQSRLRALRLATYLERWELAAELAEPLLHQKQLRPFEQVLPYGALALDALRRDDDALAESMVNRARQIIDELGLDVPGTIHRDLAVVYFALGEVRRVRAERLLFIPLPTRFGEVLERRCQLILDAQSAYSDTMRARDSHWSTMAGYRVGELYASLHKQLMASIKEFSLEGLERRQLFEGAMRLRYAVLVQKSLHMLDHTLSMAERAGENSEWVERAKATREELLRENQREEDAIDRLPYSREALTFALARMLQSKEKPPAKPTAPAREAR